MKFVIGLVIGYNYHKAKVFYAYVQENPSDIKVIEFKENVEKVKAAWKETWANTKNKMEFDKIISENNLNTNET